jgi:hypothetical protein
MKKEVFVEDYNDEMTDEFESEIALEDIVDEDEANEDARIQHLIDQMEERALIEESEEEALIDAAEEDRLIAEGERQALIDAYIERQYVEQCLSEQEDEEVLIEQMQQQQLDDEEDAIDSILNEQQSKQGIVVVEEDDDDPDDNVLQNVAAHRQVLLLMRQHNHLDVYVKKEEILISCFGITRLKYKLNDNGWHWIFNYLETGCYEDYGVDPLKVTDIDCESCVKELIEQGCNIARVPFLRETEAYIEICAFFRYGKLYFSIRRNDDFMNYLIEKGL